jgi:hypothetical protein
LCSAGINAFRFGKKKLLCKFAKKHRCKIPIYFDSISQYITKDLYCTLQILLFVPCLRVSSNDPPILIRLFFLTLTPCRSTLQFPTIFSNPLLQHSVLCYVPKSPPSTSVFCSFESLMLRPKMRKSSSYFSATASPTVHNYA